MTTWLVYNVMKSDKNRGRFVTMSQFEILINRWTPECCTCKPIRKLCIFHTWSLYNRLKFGSFGLKRFTSQSQYIGDLKQGLRCIAEMEQSSWQVWHQIKDCHLCMVSTSTSNAAEAQSQCDPCYWIGCKTITLNFDKLFSYLCKFHMNID